MPKLAWALGSLAPAAACALLTFSVFNRGNPGVASHREPMVAAVLGDQVYAAYAAADFGGRQNTLFSVTFDWTNHGGLPSSMSPSPRGETNY